MTCIKKNNRKAQISIEFVLIFSIVFFVLIGFIYLIDNRIKAISEENDFEMMKELANNIKNEIIIASSVNNRYYRKFELPNKINGKNYNIELNKEELTINLYEKEKILRSYFTILPHSIKGGFAEKINESTKEHCITKNNYDDIRIAKNQISLDSLSSSIYDNFDFIVKKEDEFDIYVNLFCVSNVRSVQFTIKYNPEYLEFINANLLTQSNSIENPLFNSADAYPLNDKSITIDGVNYLYIDLSKGRFSFAIIGNECVFGSGRIAKLKFKAKNITENFVTDISFDEEFKDENLKILDCNFNEKTKEDLPDTKKGAIIKII